jgi:hypothetical protein
LDILNQKPPTVSGNEDEVFEDFKEEQKLNFSYTYKTRLLTTNNP